MKEKEFSVQYQNPQIPTQGIDINTDATTWALPEGAIARLGRGACTSFAISPDRRYLAVGTLIGVWWYELSTLSPVALWETERGVISALDFSPNGKRLVTGNLDGTIKIWDVQRGVCITKIQRRARQYENGALEVWAGNVVFSTDNQYIAAARNGEGMVYLWAAETGKLSATLSPDPEITTGLIRVVPRPLCFSSDGQLLACVSAINTDGTTVGTSDFISVWNVKSGKQIATLKGSTAVVHTLDFSPCGQLLAAGDASGILHEWDIATGKQVQMSSKYAEKPQETYVPLPVVIPAYSPSGVLHNIGRSQGKTRITLWNVEHSEKLNTLKHHQDIQNIYFSKGITWNRDSQKPVVVFTSVRDINVWTLDNPNSVVTASIDTASVESVAFSPDGQTLANVSRGGFSTCWDVSKKQARQHLPAKVHIHFFSPSGNIRALSSVENRVYVWDIETNETIATLAEHPKKVNTAAYAHTNEVWATGDIAGNLYVSDRKGKQITLSGHTASIESLAFSPNGNQLVSISKDKTARVWDIPSGKEVASLPLNQLESERYLGDLHQKQRLRKTQLARSESGDTTQPSVEIKAIAFSPRGDIIAGGLSREIRLWDATIHDIRTAILLPKECQCPYALAFSPCGQYLASGSWWAGTEKVSTRLWDITTCENIHTFWGHPTDVQDLAFSPDGMLLASGSADGTILLWDVKSYP